MQLKNREMRRGKVIISGNNHPSCCPSGQLQTRYGEARRHCGEMARSSASGLLFACGDSPEPDPDAEAGRF